MVLCTHPFEVTARNIARVMGLPDYPFAVLDHPIGSLSVEEVRVRAEDAYQQSVTILLEE